MDLIYKEECYRIVGACFEVYKERAVVPADLCYREGAVAEL